MNNSIWNNLFQNHNFSEDKIISFNQNQFQNVKARKSFLTLEHVIMFAIYKQRIFQQTKSLFINLTITRVCWSVKFYLPGFHVFNYISFFCAPLWSIARNGVPNQNHWMLRSISLDKDSKNYIACSNISLKLVGTFH